MRSKVGFFVFINRSSNFSSQNFLSLSLCIRILCEIKVHVFKYNLQDPFSFHVFNLIILFFCYIDASCNFSIIASHHLLSLCITLLTGTSVFSLAVL